MRRQPDPGIDAPVTELGQQLKLFQKTIRRRQQVDVADMSRVRLAEERLRERHAFQHAQLHARLIETLADPIDIAHGGECGERILGCVPVQLLEHKSRYSGRAKAFQIVIHERRDALVQRYP